MEQSRVEESFNSKLSSKMVTSLFLKLETSSREFSRITIEGSERPICHLSWGHQAEFSHPPDSPVTITNGSKNDS